MQDNHEELVAARKKMAVEYQKARREGRRIRAWMLDLMLTCVLAAERESRKKRNGWR